MRRVLHALPSRDSELGRTPAAPLQIGDILAKRDAEVLRHDARRTLVASVPGGGLERALVAAAEKRQEAVAEVARASARPRSSTTAHEMHILFPQGACCNWRGAMPAHNTRLPEQSQGTLSGGNTEVTSKFCASMCITCHSVQDTSYIVQKRCFDLVEQGLRALARSSAFAGVAARRRSGGLGTHLEGPLQGSPTCKACLYARAMRDHYLREPSRPRDGVRGKRCRP